MCQAGGSVTAFVACLTVLTIAGNAWAVTSEQPAFDMPQFELNAADIQRDAMLTVEADADTEVSGGGQSNTDLAKKTQNPVADLISLPFQYNLNFNGGPESEPQHVLNIQPVIPLSLNDDWNLITRTIVPVIQQPTLFQSLECTLNCPHAISHLARYRLD